MANKPKTTKNKTAKLDRNELSKLAFSMLEDSQTKPKKPSTKTTKPTSTTKYIKNTTTTSNRSKNSASPQSVVNKYIKTKPNSDDVKKYPTRSERLKNKRYDSSIYNKKSTNKVTKTKKENEELIIYDDAVLLNYYIGDNHKKIARRFFNFSAFFFTAIYYLYRKLYIIGSIVLTLSLIVLYYVKDIKILGIILLLTSFIMGALFNFIYKKKAMRNIEKIKNKHINENINELCVLAGGTDSLSTTLITILYFLIIILFYFPMIFSLVTNLIDFSNKIEVKENTTVFKDMIESYSLQARQNIEQPGRYKYKMGDEEYNFISLPVAADDGNIYCVKPTKEEKWQNKEGFEVKENSVSCEEFMEDIINNYSSFYEIELPISGEIVISNEGKIIEGSKIIFEDKTCEYQINIKDFKCD